MAPKARYTRCLWSDEEDHIVDRYAAALANGRYRDISDASRACEQDLRKLGASPLKDDADHPGTARIHPFGSIRRRLRERQAVLGLRWTGKCLSPDEERVLSRFVRALVKGRYHDAARAASDCAGELARLGPTVGRARPLTARNIARRIYVRAHDSRRPWGYTRWSPHDDRVVKSYARAFVRGEFATTELAARACRKELCRTVATAHGNLAGRPPGAVKGRLREAVQAMGVRKYPRWTKAERRVLDRYMRALFAGRFHHIRPAADACAREMRQRFGQAARSDKDSPGSAGRHTAGAVYQLMVREVARLGLPRFNGEKVEEEKRLFEDYARAVARGEFKTCLDAAPACLAELRQVYTRLGRTSPLHIGNVEGRSLTQVHRWIAVAADRLGLQFPGRPWQPAEKRIFESWLRWYDRHHHIWRLQPLRQAGEGLSEDLAKKGYRRSVCACKQRLIDARRDRMG